MNLLYRFSLGLEAGKWKAFFDRHPLSQSWIRDGAPGWIRRRPGSGSSSIPTRTTSSTSRNPFNPPTADGGIRRRSRLPRGPPGWLLSSHGLERLQRSRVLSPSECRFGISNCSFKLFRREALTSLHLEEDHFFIDHRDCGSSSTASGYRYTQNGVRHYPRTSGKSTVKLSDVPFTFAALLKLWVKLRLDRPRPSSPLTTDASFRLGFPAEGRLQGGGRERRPDHGSGRDRVSIPCHNRDRLRAGSRRGTRKLWLLRHRRLLPLVARPRRNRLPRPRSPKPGPAGARPLGLPPPESEPPTGGDRDGRTTSRSHSLPAHRDLYPRDGDQGRLELVYESPASIRTRSFPEAATSALWVSASIGRASSSMRWLFPPLRQILASGAAAALVAFYLGGPGATAAGVLLGLGFLFFRFYAALLTPALAAGYSRGGSDRAAPSGSQAEVAGEIARDFGVRFSTALGRFEIPGPSSRGARDSRRSAATRSTRVSTSAWEPDIGTARPEVRGLRPRRRRRTLPPGPFPGASIDLRDFGASSSWTVSVTAAADVPGRGVVVQAGDQRLKESSIRGSASIVSSSKRRDGAGAQASPPPLPRGGSDRGERSGSRPSGSIAEEAFPHCGSWCSFSYLQPFSPPLSAPAVSPLDGRSPYRLQSPGSSSPACGLPRCFCSVPGPDRGRGSGFSSHGVGGPLASLRGLGRASLQSLRRPPSRSRPPPFLSGSSQAPHRSIRAGISDTTPRSRKRFGRGSSFSTTTPDPATC